jgi:hypothetical protein
VAVDIELFEGSAGPALRHYTAEVEVARRSADPIRLVWCLYYVAICRAVLREPERGIPAAEESLAVAEGTVNPTARSMARYALGLVLKKSDPGRALALFDEAAALAESVHNFWWQGIALMEAAATRAVHRDPADAAGDLLAVLNHWDRVGDWTQQWLNLRYVTRLLARLGRDEDAMVLHRALRAAGKSSPLSGVHSAAPPAAPPSAGAPAGIRTGDEALSGPAAVTFARSALHRIS